MQVHRHSGQVSQTDLQGSEDLGAGGSALQASIQQAVERARGISLSLHGVVLTISLLNTLCRGKALHAFPHGGGMRGGCNIHLVGVCQVELGEHAASAQESNAVGGSVVGEADGETVLSQLVGVGRGHNHITSDGGVDCEGAQEAAESDSENAIHDAEQIFSHAHQLGR